MKFVQLELLLETAECTNSNEAIRRGRFYRQWGTKILSLKISWSHVATADTKLIFD